jgi:hypothetical protein
MSLMKPRITNTIVAVSLLLSTSILVFWIFSYRHSFYLQIKTTKPFEPVRTPAQAAAWERHRKAHGWCGLYNFHYVATAVSKGSWYLLWGDDGEIETAPGPPPRIRCGKDAGQMLLICDNSGFSLLTTTFPNSYRYYAGFSSFQLKLGPAIDQHFVGLPLWSALVAAIIPSTMFGAKRLSARRAKLKGLCPRCGYDMRFSPERCPECGEQR